MQLLFAVILLVLTIIILPEILFLFLGHPILKLIIIFCWAVLLLVVLIYLIKESKYGR